MRHQARTAFDARGTVLSAQAGDMRAGEAALLKFYTIARDIKRAPNGLVKIYYLSIAWHMAPMYTRQVLPC